MSKVIVQVATISHKFGDNVYVSKTKEGLNKQVADFCREWWNEIPNVEIPETDDDIIEIYFSEEFQGQIESVTFHDETELGE
jgi:hypothetical protein